MKAEITLDPTRRPDVNLDKGWMHDTLQALANHSGKHIQVHSTTKSLTKPELTHTFKPVKD